MTSSSSPFSRRWCVTANTLSKALSRWTFFTLTFLVLFGSTTAFRNTDAEPPHFIVEPISQTVKYGDPVTLRCEAEPSDAIIHWLYNNEDIDSDPDWGISIQGNQLHIESFHYKKEETTHLGIYQCVASNDFGVILSRDATLEKAVIKQFDDNAVDIYVNATEGNTAVVPCDPPRGVPPPTILFEVNSTTITQNTGRHKIMPSGNLQIAKVKQSDQGVYQCVAINPTTGQKRTAPNRIHLNIIAPVSNSPTRIVHAPEERIKSTTGSNVTLECVVTGSPVPVITWTKYGGQLPEGRYVIDFGNLILYNLQLTDTGTYICRAENGEGQAPAEISALEVQEPPSIRTAPHSQVVNVGSPVTFTCRGRGHPRVRLEWLHNGQLVISDTAYNVTDTTLTINYVQPIHGGIYQCIARNRLGMVYRAASLDVRPAGEDISHLIIDPPSDPDGMQDIAPDLIPGGQGNDNNNEEEEEKYKDVLDMYTEPPRPDLDVFLPYDVDYFDADPPRNRDRNTDSSSGRRRNNNRRNRQRNRNRGRDRDRDPDRIHLTGPEPYDAEDEDDFDYPDEPSRSGGSSIVRPSKPEVTKLSDTSVMLTWELNEDPANPVQFFRIQYKLSGSRQRPGWLTSDGEIPGYSRRYEVSGLEPGRKYRFRVSVVYKNNRDTHSPAARFLLQIVPEHKPMVPVGRPSILVAEAREENSIFLKWRYRVVDHAPIDGFIIYYRLYSHDSRRSRKYRQHRVYGPSTDQYTLGQLDPATPYQIYVTSFNSAGESEDSNKAAPTTLGQGERGYDLDYDPDVYGKVIEEGDQPEEEVIFPGNRLSTQSSNDQLYMILGIVLGIVLLLLIIFSAMCFWKQRQHQRMMTYNGGAAKFQDPAKTIYNDSLRKKYLINGSPFVLNGIQPNLSNGNVPHAQSNGTLPQYGTAGPPNDGSQMNISVNRLSDLPDGEFKQNISLPPPPMIPPPNAPPLYESTQGRISPYPSDLSEADNETALYSSVHQCRDRTCCDPPELSIYARPHSPVLSSFRSHRSPPAPPPRPTHMYDYHTYNPRRAHAEDFFQPRSYNSMTRNYSLRASPHDMPLQSNDYDCVEPVHHSHKRSNRRRRRRRPHSGNEPGVPRERGTNTDYSSNDGTLEQHSTTYVPPLPPPNMLHDDDDENPYFSRANDYSPSDHELN